MGKGLQVDRCYNELLGASLLRREDAEDDAVIDEEAQTRSAAVNNGNNVDGEYGSVLVWTSARRNVKLLRVLRLITRNNGSKLEVKVKGTTRISSCLILATSRTSRGLPPG